MTAKPAVICCTKGVGAKFIMKNNINKTALGKKTSAGFTIIEVLIVLAIAGLIILIVLLAIPALQRNNRNTARKSDISRIAGALTNFVSNNNGDVPVAALGTNAATILADAGALGQYRAPFAAAATLTNNRLNVVAAGAGTPGPLLTTSIDQVQIVTGGVCAGAGATNVNATGRNLAIQYTVESGTNGVVTPICQNI